MPDANGAVVDASVAVKFVVEEEGSDKAAHLLDGRPLFAPSLVFVEAANALWVMNRRSVLTADETDDALHLLLGLPLRAMPAAFDPVPHALRLARLLGHPVYDCVYLALAIEVGQPVVTADGRFYRATRSDADVAPLVRMLDEVDFA